MPSAGLSYLHVMPSAGLRASKTEVEARGGMKSRENMELQVKSCP